ncbi:MAG: phosphoribosylaminoimidazolesuccinocarboxamide synthase [Defluviitaleaceae bacterium]|nr:phosphoribosylaminoimidazolesuccinocarboxamide synthase [Defluviitaleaceae bacterium]
MKKLELLYSGKAKSVYKTDNIDQYLLEFRDDLTAGNGAKKGSFQQKGVINNKISNLIFKELERSGVKTHFIQKISDTEVLVRKAKLIDLEVVIRNVAAGSFAKRYGLEEGSILPLPILEFFYKNDNLDDPFINDDGIIALNIATKEELEIIRTAAHKTNEILKKMFDLAGLNLIDFKIEFGKTDSGEIILIDEISPDCCRLWEKDTNEKMDKDRFRRDLGGVALAYLAVLDRLSAQFGKE